MCLKTIERRVHSVFFNLDLGVLKPLFPSVPGVFKLCLKRAGLLNTVGSHFLTFLFLAPSGCHQQRGVGPCQEFSATGFYDGEEKALISRSAARPGEMTPLVTRSSRPGRARLTLG